MSRRREEAELKRVLQLSTQQVQAVGALPPYTLSSASTDDSREMELRPVNPASTGESPFTPNRPASRRWPYLLSPDPVDDDYSFLMPQTRVEVVVPSHPRSHLSPDPIDALDPSVPPEFRDIHFDSAGDIQDGYSFAPSGGTGGAAGTDDALLGLSLATETSHVPSSSMESSRRSSARQETVKDKKAADTADRKRKRPERKAKEAAAAVLAEVSGEPLPHTTLPASKRKTKKAKTNQAKQSVVHSMSQRQGLEEASIPPLPTAPSCADERDVHVAPSAAMACTVDRPTTEVVANSSLEACGGARAESGERSNMPVTEGVISSVEPDHHSSPRPRSSPNVRDEDSSSPAAVVTPKATRVLRPAHHMTSSSASTPSGGRWRTPRNDLAGVLSKFPGARRTGMSKRLNIVPLHASIGPGVKALPPPPPKSKKKVEEEEDEDEEDENGNPKVKVGSREWLMMED
ncbi:unnamed protein product [Cutaneotrichosporon oleaginosum]